MKYYNIPSIYNPSLMGSVYEYKKAWEEATKGKIFIAGELQEEHLRKMYRFYVKLKKLASKGRKTRLW